MFGTKQSTEDIRVTLIILVTSVTLKIDTPYITSVLHSQLT